VASIPEPFRVRTNYHSTDNIINYRSSDGTRIKSTAINHTSETAPMNRSYLARLHALADSCLFDLRWKLGIIKKAKSTRKGVITHLPDGELFYIGPTEGRTSTDDAPLK
jgi:hypothetical protein